MDVRCYMVYQEIQSAIHENVPVQYIEKRFYKHTHLWTYSVYSHYVYKLTFMTIHDRNAWNEIT